MRQAGPFRPNQKMGGTISSSLREIDLAMARSDIEKFFGLDERCE
jgi:hypothetical protein